MKLNWKQITPEHCPNCGAHNGREHWEVLHVCLHCRAPIRRTKDADGNIIIGGTFERVAGRVIAWIVSFMILGAIFWLLSWLSY